MQIKILHTLTVVAQSKNERWEEDNSVAVNMHTMGASFVGKIRDVWQIAEAQVGEGIADIVEFLAEVSGHVATEKAGSI